MIKDCREGKNSLQKLEWLIENPIQWEEPIQLGPKPPMEFNIDWLPSPLGEYADYISRSMQVPVDMPGIAILSVLALCNAGKYVVEAKEDYNEPLNMYCVIVGNPSERKSAVLKEVTGPVIRYEEEENERLKIEIAKNFSEKSILQRELKILEEQAVKDYNKKSEALKKAEELSSFHDLHSKRYFVDDITIEKLASVICEQDGKIGVISGEGNIFDVFAGQYSKKESFDCVLKGYTGESLRVDRQGRASEYVKNPAITMLLCIQPSVLESVMSNKNFQGRGLVSRILFSYPQSRIGTRKFQTKSIPRHVKESYNNLIKNLMGYRSNEARVLKLTNGALLTLNAFFEEIESRLIGDMEPLQAFGGKLVGLVLRICGNIHIAKHPREPEKLLIEPETMDTAICLGRYAISHAFKAYDSSKDSVTENCRYIVNRISHNGKEEELSKRDLLRLCQKYKSMDELNPFLDRLQELGYIEPIEEENTGRGRPSEKYNINPHIFKLEDIPVLKASHEEDFNVEEIFEGDEYAL